jgi:hypothetical protein
MCFDKEITEMTIPVDGRPSTAGIDPLNKLIDTMPDDNTGPVHFSISETQH